MMKKNKLERILFIPDCHIPFEDKKAMNLMFKAANEFKPDHVIIQGDFIDCYSVSSHAKDPNRSLKLKEEVDETIKVLKRVKDLGAKNNVFIEGNHEDRLLRYLKDKAPELFNFISIPKILELDKLGFKHVPYKEHYTIGKLNVTHDTGGAGRFAVHKALDSFQHNVLIGHVHNINYTVGGNSQGERHVAASFGWLGDIESIDYMHKAKVKKDWSHGFGIGYLDKSTGVVYVVPIPIINYTCVLNGKLYKI